MSKIAVNEITDEVGTGAPAFPNGMSVTGAALTDPEITGGIYLGGTGSANKLEDYEEGTWTISLSDGTNSAIMASDTMSYIKVGNMVTLTGRFACSDTSALNSSDDIQIRNLPFSVSNGDFYRSGISVGFVQGLTLSGDYAVSGYLIDNQASGRFTVFETSSGTDVMTFSDIGNSFNAMISVTYFTDS